MTALDLPAIRALLEGVTEGPWFANRYYVFAGEDTSDPDADVARASFKADAAFIAVAPSIVAQLVAVVERVEGLHVPVIEYGEPVGCKTCDWEVSGTWPCETIRAITGEGQ